MIKPNWKIFEAKFTDNPQDNFEWFCYLLFCKEFDKPMGIHRYKNQSAIETDPIEKEGEIIGWQAKFFEQSLSKSKHKLIVAITTAKRDYPSITKLILYTNQQWGQNRGKEPTGKKEIEKKAKSLNIELVWRTKSFFESSFVSIENEIISKHFFTLEKSIFDLIKSQDIHTNNILNEIQTTITFEGQNIKIDRSNDIKRIQESPNRVLILSGSGGVGKTALIKDVYKGIEIPFYVFKASEFELRSINDFFTGYSFTEFFANHQNDVDKIIVIDSAEKLLDIKNRDPFKEFLSTAIKENWKVIFTTRDNYLEELNYEFFEIYKIAPININIQNLEFNELDAMSKEYHFLLPTDGKLLTLIKNPFYLKEYLKFYKKDEQINYTDFKERLWSKIISKFKPAREQCFLRIAYQRANDGQFFVNPNCDSEILDNELTKDGILGYESPYGYFITHDIYEEWALEKVIETEFIKKINDENFFENIGSSLPIRRALRKWISEKLSSNSSDIKNFIEDMLKDDAIEPFWKDEILVSILLSEYSGTFFHIFREELLVSNQKLLKKLTFLIRIACKEVDETLFKRLGAINLNLFTLEYIWTKPKGEGWKSLIRFVFENLSEIGIENIYFILPIIHDWSGQFKEGETTRISGLISLQYYQWFIENDGYFSKDDRKDHLLQTIVYCSSEIKNELEIVIQEVLKNKWKNHRDPYYDLSKFILTEINGIHIFKIHPTYILQLADLFWSFTPTEDTRYERHSAGMEQYFNLEDEHLDYFPVSAYQTPIYWLLQFSIQETIDFILSFTNKTVEYFAKCKFAEYEVEEINIFVEQNKPIKQYTSGRLWNMYRGTQAAPHVLVSIHMALESFFLQNGKTADSKVLESWLLYILKNSKSSSLSAVVTSIVLAYPEKTFNVAKILFRTKEFFFADTDRWIIDQTQKDSLLSLQNQFGVNLQKEIHERDRLNACDDAHRKLSLEHLFLNYQLFRLEETSENEFEKRQQVLWKILDDYYKELSNLSKETNSDKIWRLYLTRVDKRKMKPTTKKSENGFIVNLNPEVEPELKKYSENSLEKNSEQTKYFPLKLWANYKIRNDERFKQYIQYDDNPKTAIKEVRQIITKLKKIKKPEPYKLEHSEEESFYILNHSIPAEVCSILIRDYLEKLSPKERTFCVRVILKVASVSSNPNYQYRSDDASASVISILPIVLKKYPEKKPEIKQFLLFSLFNYYPIDMAGTSFNTFTIMAFHELWKKNFEDAQSILIAYLYLRPRYNTLKEKIRQENRKNNEDNMDEDQIMKLFLKENGEFLQKMINNQVTFEEIGLIEKTDLYTLKTVFQLIPVQTQNLDHKELIKEIIFTFSEKLISDDREDRIDYTVRHDFLKKLAYFILQIPKEEISDYIKPFLNKFKSSKTIGDLFEEFISAEDYLNSYENFWEVWNLFKKKIIEICKDEKNYWYLDKIIKSYLFAQNPWKDSATNWHTFKSENKIFFKEISTEIGRLPSTIYSLSKLVNGIGSIYLDDAIFWLSDILQNNEGLSDKQQETNTVYYVENLMRKYIYTNREKIKKIKELKQKVLNILDFLIKKGSVVGYMLRESIL